MEKFHDVIVSNVESSAEDARRTKHSGAIFYDNVSCDGLRLSGCHINKSGKDGLS